MPALVSILICRCFRGCGVDKLRVLDLFSGIGGFSLGLERTGGFETVAFCEIEAFPRKVLAKHWPEVPCYDDVRTLTAERLDADGIAVDVITGGFPCQDISVAGNQAGLGEGTRSGLWSEIIRLTCELRPQFVIVENVANLLSGPSEKRGGWFGRVLGDLAECGYDAEWQNIRAAAVGLPHERQRAWLVAYPAEVGRIVFGHSAPGATYQRSIPHSFGSFEHRWKREDGRHSMERVGWSVKPAIRGSNDGLPTELDKSRVGALGNAVVPQIPELIGRAILAAIENENA
jgi:DNA (cytosine-5)-methyltransferase 1